MFSSRHNLFLRKEIVVIFLASVISYSGMSIAQDSSLYDEAIEQSILSRYKQILLDSYDFYHEKLGLKFTEQPSSIQNFPLLLDKSNQCFPEQAFQTERFFSSLNKQGTKPKKTFSKVKSKIIRISNIPVNNGFLSSHFGFRKDPMHGSRRLHKGIDIAAKYASPVRPLGEGLVMFSGYKSGYGNTVEIKHGNSVLTRYAHLKEYFVDAGQKVNVGDKIGLIGSTGRSTGPHLHLEVLLNGDQVDPQIFLANHFGSRSNPQQIAVKTKELPSIMQKVATTAADKSFPSVSNFPQISYQDFVQSVNVQFGFSAPDTFSQ